MFLSVLSLKLDAYDYSYQYKDILRSNQHNSNSKNYGIKCLSHSFRFILFYKWRNSDSEWLKDADSCRRNQQGIEISCFGF